ncbi:hypothetical protein NQD34_008354, partial [Periophthalmus magnuspinnatus]
MNTMQFFSVFLLLLGVSLGLAAPSELQQVKLERGDCPMFWYSYNGRCYKYVATHMTWADAEMQCVSQGANLVSIHSVEENNFVKNLIQNFDHTLGQTWIGLSDIHLEGAWMWSDGCPLRFKLWNSEEPNNKLGTEHCVLIVKNWDDYFCSQYAPSICATR